MMTWYRKAWFVVLATLDQLFPGWSAPAAPRADYLSDESLQFWLEQVNLKRMPE